VPDYDQKAVLDAVRMKLITPQEGREALGFHGPYPSTYTVDQLKGRIKKQAFTIGEYEKAEAELVQKIDALSRRLEAEKEKSRQEYLRGFEHGKRNFSTPVQVISRDDQGRVLRTFECGPEGLRRTA
jgi:hypothetical protein